MIMKNFLVGLVTTCFLSAAAILPVQAEEGTRGGAFFLLSDASYGANEPAMVRLEAQDMSAVAEYGGADIYVYRVKQPLDFLKRQKNLHRIDVKGDYAGPGLANALTRIWDNWWMESRSAWRELFSREARQAVTEQAPGVRSHPLVNQSSPPEKLHPKYRPLKAHTLVDSFRYPVQFAQPIKPPAGVKLSGSSSEFIQPQKGNVLIPLGQREPGLYLVEAMVGDYRAVTLVFVSDTIAVTKVSSNQMLVWAADRRKGNPVGGTEVVWSDGVGVLGSNGTDKRGVVLFQRAAPEKTYVFGEDPQGGVFIAENYYYDSEIYNTKLYAVTDRPLYRAGDTVFVKFLGRTFRSARESSAIQPADLKLEVFDANGFPVAGQNLRITPQTGADTSFQLPDNAVAGGYELRFTYKGDAYGAAFRVAEYQKPHFEINVLPEKRDFKTGEKLKGQIQLVYPDGKPVADAKVELSVRAQRLSMIEGDLGYAGQFPVQLSTAVFETDAKGMAPFELPAADEPSRYVVTVLATDGAAYRVRSTKEILVERGAGTYALKSERAFSAVAEEVRFAIRALSTIDTAPVASWEWVRLENRKRASGALKAGEDFSVIFQEPGTYTVSLRDARGNIVGAASHYVSGPGIGAPQGSVEMVFDKTQYKPGDTAQALITFPQKVDQALFTLERDRVEKTALMSGGAPWVRAVRLSPMQWRASIPVREDYGPNITFSVVYTKDGEYVFQNLGLKVAQPRIDIAVKADKSVYMPGETVTLDLTAQLGGKPAAGAQLTVSVVDEMIYVLQPEIAPDVFDFFYHPRRNNVRTSASLNFIGYDLAKPPTKPAVPTQRQTHQRTIKVLERPRREDKDTALWQPVVSVDKNGHARVSFTMPDSLTRWRVTVRAADYAGMVGQNIAHVRSDKNFYVKWTSPIWMRAQDAPNASVAIFNQGNSEATVELAASGAGLKRRDSIKIKPGANFLSLPLQAAANQAEINLTLSNGGKVIDALAVPLKILPTQWQSSRSLNIPIVAQETALNLPADARNVRVQFADSTALQFRRLIDDLIDYPYGCVEQTASRLLPYSLALQSLLPSDERLASPLTQRLHSSRFRLAQLAGPQATFGWWSPPDKDADALLTTYAYYADWYASRALKLDMPAGHWDRLIEVYRKQGVKRSRWHRALMLSWMQEMGLPVRSLAEALAEEQLAASSAPSTTAREKSAKPSPLTSMVLAQDEGDISAAMTTLLTAHIVQTAQGKLPQGMAPLLEKAATQLNAAKLPIGESLLMLTGRLTTQDAKRVLENVRAEMPTIDRALTLTWTYRALRGASAKNADSFLRVAIPSIKLDAPWQAIETATGQQLFRWPNGTLPNTIKLPQSPPAGLVAVAQFDSREAETSTLPVQVERRLYRMVRNDDKAANKAKTATSESTTVRGQVSNEFSTEATQYDLELIKAGDTLKTDEVYLDIIELKKMSGPALRFGILEAPLPPGAMAERTTWGITTRLPGSEAQPLERARYESRSDGYAVPVEVLNDKLLVKHLVRVSQSGKFVLPPVRYYRMYQPEQKAFEDKPHARIDIR